VSEATYLGQKTLDCFALAPVKSESAALLVIDARVEHRESLLRLLDSGAHLLVMEPSEAALDGVLTAAGAIPGLSAIHLLAHGEPGRIRLGAEVWDSEFVSARADRFTALGASLSEDGGLMLYGCESGKGEPGRALVAALSDATGAAVAASSLPVGHADQGGSWTLDVGVLAAPALAARPWPGLLGVVITPESPVSHWRGPGEYQNFFAAAAIRADGSVVAWGGSDSYQVFPDSKLGKAGGNTTAVAGALDGTVDVVQIFQSTLAFAALRADGSVVPWGFGFDNWLTVPGTAQPLLDGTIDVLTVYSSFNYQYECFAALRADGSVVTWKGVNGRIVEGLDGSIDAIEVYTTGDSFAALRADGSVVAWGGAAGGTAAVASKLDGSVDVISITGSDGAFAALRADGSVVTWGSTLYGSDSSAVSAKLDGTIDVTRIVANESSFAAIRKDGSVVTWGGKGGDLSGGGFDSSAVASKLDGTIDVVQIVANEAAFAAIRKDGSVVTWGGTGGDSSTVADQINGTIDVVSITANGQAFAALRADGSVVIWGGVGGSTTNVNLKAALDGTIDVVKIVATSLAFAAIRADGSVVSWGNNEYGGALGIFSDRDGTTDVIAISHNSGTFYGLREDGSVIAWGVATRAYDLSAVSASLTSVVSLADIATDTTANGQLNEALNGSKGNDTIYGFAGNDTLNGGLGADLMLGGAGNDIYTVDNIGDQVRETTSPFNTTNAGGTDTVRSSVNFALGQFVEHLTLTGAKAISGTGNALGNRLTGNDAANRLSGLAGNDLLNGGAGNDTLNGGPGVDTLSGGAGQDSFVFNAPFGSADRITDFLAVDDTVSLENGIFSSLATTGPLAAANFRASAEGVAADSNDFILYDTDSGALYYDADGNGAGTAVLFATLTGAPTISNADFIVT
jgi:Ca2+-binding RTX toxin-like protein